MVKIPVSSNIMALEQTVQSSELEIREVELAVPKWGWQFLQGRANSIHNGDLNVAVNEIFASGLTAYVQLSEVDMEPANKIPC